MAISQDTIERIRDTVDIVDVIDSYVPLKRSGANYKALSPFNKEKTPSFFVNPDKQMFKCFSSGNGGDVFKFVMLYENLDFPAAVRKLAERAGIEITEDQGGEDSRVREQKNRLLTLHSLVMVRWRDFLLHESAAQGARDYMRSRDIPLAWVEEFDLGYALPGWDDVLKWGQSKGYDETELLDSGLILRNERGKVYDRFRDRLVFSIQNDNGQIIGFSARALDPEVKGAKYINSPETPIFTKSKVLFGFHRAKRPILDEDEVIMCEGQIDVLRCHATGIRNVVAPLGTAFTDQHAKLIGRHTKNVVLCLDADAAGQKAASRAADVILNLEDATGKLMGADLGIRVIRLPQGHDPDTLIREQGVEAMKRLIAEPMEYIDFLVDQTGAEDGNSSPAAKRKQAAAVAEFLSRIPNAVLKEQLIMRAAMRMEVSTEALEQEIARQKTTRRRPSADIEHMDEAIEKMNLHVLVKEIMLLILADSTLIPEVQKNLTWEWIEMLPGAVFLDKVLNLYNNDLWHDLTELYPQLNSREQQEMDQLEVAGMQQVDRESLVNAVEVLCRKVYAQYVMEKLHQVNQQLREPGLSSQKQQQLLASQAELLRLKNTLTDQ
ncbi:MAG: DNA primase [Verrucomicrobiota bacterium]